MGTGYRIWLLRENFERLIEEIGFVPLTILGEELVASMPFLMNPILMVIHCD